MKNCYLLGFTLLQARVYWAYFLLMYIGCGISLNCSYTFWGLVAVGWRDFVGNGQYLDLCDAVDSSRQDVLRMRYSWHDPTRVALPHLLIIYDKMRINRNNKTSRMSLKLQFYATAEISYNIMKKKKLSLVAMLICLTSTWAKAFYVDGINYNITSADDLTVEVASDTYRGEIVIPASVQYDGKTYSVTSIGHGAFWNCVGLTSVNIPNSVTSIGGAAFYSCNGLTSVTIPNSVTSIGGETFRYCHNLPTVNIPNSVTSIGSYAFDGCTRLTSVNLSSSLTVIGDYVFGNCRSLTSITIPNSVTIIKRNAFNGCNGLTSITIPNSVISIEQNAFDSCI